MGTRSIDLLQARYPGLELYTGKRKEVFGVAGYLFNKNTSKRLINDANRM